MNIVSRTSVKLFSKIYRLIPDEAKDLFPRDLRTRVKLLINFSAFQSNEDRITQLKLEEALYHLRHSEYTQAQEKLEDLKKIIEKTVSKNYLGDVRFHLKLCETLANLDSYKTKIENYKKNKNPRIVVFSAIVDAYDKPKLPLELDPSIDYVMFSNQEIEGGGIWEIRPIRYFGSDATRTARFIKTHPHQLFPDYDLAIWVDASVGIIGDLNPLIQNFSVSKNDVGAIPHPNRKNIFEEFAACRDLAKDKKASMQEQVERYKEEGFSHSDLAETGVMFYNLSSSTLSDKMNKWWQEIDGGSRRDQLSFNYAMGEDRYFPLMEPPYSVRSHPALSLTAHNTDLSPLLIEKIDSKKMDPMPKKSFLEIKDQVISNQKERKIDVVLCVHNALEDVKKCLASIEQHHNSDNHRLIVIDDGSEADTQNFLKSFCSDKDWCQYARSEVGRGYTKAANHGLSLSQGEMVVLLNSDTMATSYWLEKLAQCLFSQDHYGIAGPLSNAASHQSVPEHKSKNKQTAINELPPGKTPEGMNQFCEENAQACYYIESPLVHGFCFAIKREVIDKIGLFDEEHFPKGYGEENDYCFRATNAGFIHAIATNTFVYHSKSKSYQSEARIELMQNGIKNLTKLHGQSRVHHSVVSLQNNPILVDLRKKAKKLYIKK